MTNEQAEVKSLLSTLLLEAHSNRESIDIDLDKKKKKSKLMHL